jgi:hypothetical protein
MSFLSTPQISWCRLPKNIFLFFISFFFFYPFSNTTDGSHVRTRRLFKDNHQRWKARKEAGPYPSFVQGYCQVFAMYATAW